MTGKTMARKQIIFYWTTSTLLSLGMFANSLLTNQGKMVSDKTIKNDYDRAVLNIQVGHVIAISSIDFDKLSKAFFQGITEKFPE